MAPPVGSLVVRVGSDIRGLTRGFKKGVGVIKSLGTAASRASKRIALISGVAAAAGVAIGVKLARDGLKAVDAMTKLGRSLGATQAEMVALNATADLVGIAQEKMQKNVGAFTKRLGEAMDGTGQAVDALKKLGFTAAELAAIPLPEALALVAERTQRLGTAAERAAVESDLFSRAGIGMLTTTGDLAGAIRQATKDTQGFGVAVSQVDAAKIEAANDAMSRIGLVIKGVSNQLAVRLAPLILEVADRFAGAAEESRGFGAAIQAGLSGSVRVVGLLINGFREFQERLLLIDVAAQELNRRRLVFLGSPEELSAANRAWEAAVETLGEFQNIPPFDADALFQNILEKADATTAALQAVKSAADVGDPLGRLTGEGDDPELEALREKLATRLEMIRQGLLSEREIEEEAFQEKLARLHEAEQVELEIDGGFKAAREALEQQHQEKLTAIQEREDRERQRNEQRAAQARIDTAFGAALAVASVVESAAQENFALQKAASIASTTIAAIESAVHSYKWGAAIGGPALGAAMAAVAFAAQAAPLAAIRSADFKRGGGARPSFATGGPTGGAPAPPGGGGGAGGGAGAQSVNISLVGERFGRTQVRDLIEEINDAVSDGARLRIV